MYFFYEEFADMHFVYGFCNGNTTAAVEEYRLQYARQRIPDRCLFTRVNLHLREKGSFPSVNCHAERQVQRNVEEDEPIRLPSVGLHESYGVCTQGEHERRTTPANSQRCKKHQQRCSAL